MTPKIKSHLIVFVSAFIVAILPIIADPSWTIAGKATLFALALTGIRAGLKAAFPY